MFYTRDDRDRSLFIVYGRDHRNLDALRSLLRKMDMKPLSWTEAVEHAGAHETLKVVEAGLGSSPSRDRSLYPTIKRCLSKSSISTMSLLMKHGKPWHMPKIQTEQYLHALAAHAQSPVLKGSTSQSLMTRWESRVALRSHLVEAGVRLDLNADLAANNAETFGAPTKSR